jgi:uncharacterized delta-60 repeat protein
VAVRPDGRILIGGKVNRFSNTGFDFLLMQLRADGSLDTSFAGGSGWLATDFSTRDEEINALALLADGKILAAGSAYTVGSVNFAVARYQSDGTLDQVASYNFPSGREDRANALALYPDGRAVLAGETANSNFGFVGQSFAALRLGTGLSPDAGFDGDGMTALNFGLLSADVARGVALQPDGKIVLVGSASCCGLALTRLEENGRVDATFGSSGFTTLAVPGAIATAGNALLRDGDGRLVTVGRVDIDQDLPYAVVARFLGGGLRPFGATLNPIPGRCEAENFDQGGQGVAYFDTSPEVNEATGAYQSGYRAGSGVDLEADTDGGNNVHLAYVRAGEWTQYSSQSPGALTHWRLHARVAAAGLGGTFRVRVDGADVTGPVQIPNTGGWLAFQTIDVPGLSAISAGPHTVRLEFLSAGANGTFVGNLSWFELMPQSCPTSLSPTNRVHGSEASTNGVTVTATGDCAWTVQNTNSWITVFPGYAGSGNGTVTYSVAANLSPTQRSGTIQIGEKSLVVVQREANHLPLLYEVTRKAGGVVSLRLRWEDPSRTYVLQFTRSLTQPITWESVNSGINHHPSYSDYTVTLNPNMSRGFYRLLQP